MSTDDFDLSRIVPSTRDLFGALATRRRGLALVTECDGADAAGRLDALEVRALAHPSGGPAMRQAATATLALPMLLLAPLDDALACQRARFFGADGVCLRDVGLAKTAQSMRMMALGWAADAGAAAAAVAAGARAVLVHAAFAEVERAAAQLPAPTLLVAQLTDPSADRLRALAGRVDAAVVPRDIHASKGFAALLDELDS